MSFKTSAIAAAFLVASLPMTLSAQSPAKTPDIEVDSDLSGLVGQLRSKLDQLRGEDEREIPLGRLAKELDQARRDIERLAELVLRKEITEIRQQSTYALAVQEIEALSMELEGAESQVAALQQERARMEAFVAQSAERVDELAKGLIAADDARRELEIALNESRADADAARNELAAAAERIATIDNEIDKIIADYDERTKLFETAVEQAEYQVGELESQLRQQEVVYERELASKDADIAELTARQVKAREVLVQALAEIDGASRKEIGAYQNEMLRSAEISSRARADVLSDLGFERDDRGQLQPPEIDLGAASDGAKAVEPAAGDGGACDGRLLAVDRPYLDDKASEDWQHYLIGTLTFDEAATRLDQSIVENVVTCLKSLSGNPAIYFKLIGHTDDRGTAAFNEQLSLARAQAVRDVFGDYVAIQPWRLFAQGRGEHYPLADNGSELGRSENRRVEVYAVKAAF